MLAGIRITGFLFSRGRLWIFRGGDAGLDRWKITVGQTKGQAGIWEREREQTGGSGTPGSGRKPWAGEGKGEKRSRRRGWPNNAPLAGAGAVGKGASGFRAPQVAPRPGGGHWRGNVVALGGRAPHPAPGGCSGGQRVTGPSQGLLDLLAPGERRVCKGVSVREEPV